MSENAVEIAVGVTVYVRHSDGRVLLGQKGSKSSMPGNKNFEGKWVTPGGRVNFCETLQAAAIRETREETGLWIEPPMPLFVHEIIFHPRPGLRGAHFVLHVMSSRVADHCPEESLRCGDDLVDVRWCDTAQLHEFWPDMTELTHKILRRYHRNP